MNGSDYVRHGYAGKKLKKLLVEIAKAADIAGATYIDVAANRVLVREVRKLLICQFVSPQLAFKIYICSFGRSGCN